MAHDDAGIDAAGRRNDEPAADPDVVERGERDVEHRPPERRLIWRVDGGADHRRRHDDLVGTMLEAGPERVEACGLRRPSDAEQSREVVALGGIEAGIRFDDGRRARAENGVSHDPHANALDDRAGKRPGVVLLARSDPARALSRPEDSRVAACRCTRSGQ